MRAGARAPAAALAAAAVAVSAAPAVLAVSPAAAASASGSPTATPSRSQRLAVGGPKMASSGIVVNYPSSGKYPKLPKIPAGGYVIADANTGQVLAAKDPHGQFAPASTLKVLTAVTLIPALNPSAMVKTTRLAADQEPNDVGLVRGRQYQVANLFRALLLISANDAAVALTQATGSFSKGMAMINAEAHHLQAYDVVAKLPNGLPAKGQVVSAYDEALIARSALSIPAFMRYDSTLAARFLVNYVKKKHQAKKKPEWVTLVNQNYLLTQYRGGIGGKIGWTEKSEATYIGLARRNGVTLIVTVLHCTPLQEISSGEKLLTWGFRMAGQVKPVGTLVPPLPSAAVLRQEQQAKAAQQARLMRARRRSAHQHAVQVASQAEARSSGHMDVGLAVGVGAIAVLGLGGIARQRRRQSRRS
ncbi:MAG TPA: D-alanyl-D-alanine carboxypeptidase [Streptosporangiaceae bacterium]|nr:D-alanyl-D-alanine carboxypeptidase [Streptosporangiaceae bacterium]